MILDKLTMFADGLAHNGASTVLDLETLRPGPGQPIKCFIQGSADLAGCTGFTVTDGATNAAAGALITHVASLAGNLVEFEIPSDAAQFVKVTLTGSTSAGTWSAGVVLAGSQTNT